MIKAANNRTAEIYEDVFIEGVFMVSPGFSVKADPVFRNRETLPTPLKKEPPLTWRLTGEAGSSSTKFSVGKDDAKSGSEQ